MQSPWKDAAANLAILGVGELGERAYRILLRSPGLTVTGLADRIGSPAARVRRVVTVLEQSGLVTRSPLPTPRLLPVAPDAAIEALVRRQESELERVRALAASWVPEFRSGGNAAPTELIEVVTGADTVLSRFDQLQRGAMEEVQVLDTPPYAGDAGPITNDAEFEVLARGVTCRAIYARAALEQSPNAVTAILRYVAAGEQARVTSELPLKLATFDRKVAFIPQSIAQRDIAGAIVVHPCSLLDVLLFVFDQLWAEATPLTAAEPLRSTEQDGAAEPSENDRRVLALLAGGLKNEAIAHHLGWSHRTTRRRIATLMAALGADTRFQAGLYAARAGWL
ncbi:helix-turn-helix transcriptional regulator [Kribbella capetownensis]|uniref:helix-turn-helix transcriptional regulator n=1 Tax=Kribbella capetownensis TaxID=1572659 RepID=UPI0013F4952C|nr:LuxR family transcriptional regulator [Kribbella capetownensis]